MNETTQMEQMIGSAWKAPKAGLVAVWEDDGQDGGVLSWVTPEQAAQMAQTNN